LREEMNGRLRNTETGLRNAQLLLKSEATYMESIVGNKQQILELKVKNLITSNITSLMFSCSLGLSYKMKGDRDAINGIELGLIKLRNVLDLIRDKK
jgi:hypothetical protein